MQEEEGNCVVEPKAQVAECAIRAGEGRHVLVARGPAGAGVFLRWAPRRGAGTLVDGEYAEPNQRLPLEPVAPGEYLLGFHDVPGDRDAAPLGCALERQPEQGGPRELVAWDAPRVGGGRTFQRAFNYARYEALWFEVTEAGEFTLTTGGERTSACELSRVLADGLERIAEGGPKDCRLTRRLPAGLYLLKLSGGTEGIEKARIAPAGAARDAGDSPARSACFLRARVEPGYRYALVASRSGRVAARGLVARKLPLTLDTPLPVEVPAGETLTLPVGAVGSIRIATPGGSPAGCHLAKAGAGQWRDGACWLDAKVPDQLGLAAKPGAPLLAWLVRPAPARAAEVAAPFEPARDALPVLAAGEPARFDFEPAQARALVFEVKEPGLHDVGTEGLLATSCAIRTPALPQLASDRSGGRGRNCLVSTFLRAGRYLVSVRALAPSRGRAAVTLTRRPARELPALDGSADAVAERFFRAGAGELVRQRIAVPKAGRWELSATALGAALQCRLEDREGWPLEQVPGPCRTTQELPAGEVVWTQLPLTVESMRRTAVALELAPLVLRDAGAAPELELWRPYAAELGKRGRGEFRFHLPAEGDVSILLTNGMLGRVYRDGEAQPVELIPPDDGGAAPAASPETGEAAAPDEAPAGDEVVEDGGSETGDGEEGEPVDGGETPAGPVPRAPPPEPVAPDAAPGVKVHLAAGDYRLVTEHARGDVAISYRLQVSVDPLMPGVARDLPVPTAVTVRVADAGTLRIRTAGEADVRCRLFDAGGRRLAESGEVGEDWNCGLAEPVAAGDYRLELESEVVEPGRTRLSLAQPAPADVGALADGAKYPLGAGVLSAALAPPAGDAVVEAALEAPAPFSCALDDDAGRLVARSGPGTSCAFFLLPAGKTWRLRAWTLDRPTEVTARLRVRPVTERSGGTLAEGGAARATVARPGTYRTSDGVRCLAAPAGLLLPCGPEVSLDAGAVVFAAPAAAALPLDELTTELGAGDEKPLTVGPRARLQRQRSGSAVAHLVAVTVAPGQRTVPACALDGGVHVPTPGGCYAASGSGKESLLRLVASEPVESRVWRAAVTQAKEVDAGAGRHRLEVAPGGTLLSLPSGPARAELTLPPRAWAVLLSDGKAIDLCPPATALTRCVLTGAERVRVLLVAHGEKRVELVVTRLPAPPPVRDLAGLHEQVAALPGTQAWRLPGLGAERLLRVDGATGCTVALDDGARLGACEAAIPAGVAGTVVVEHRAGPLRLLLAPREDGLALAAGAAASASPKKLSPGEAVSLEGLQVDRAIDLAAESVVHLRADRGSCLILSGGRVVASGGLGEGCRLDRLLGKGTHRLVVRAFAGAPLAGTAAYTAEPVQTLQEGAGPERWLAPGEAQLFRFTLATRGRVGLGLREEAETLACAVLDQSSRPLGEGCQQLLSLEAGTYLLAVRAPADAPASRYRPVLLGLAGADAGVPGEYLRDFFQRIGGTK